MKNPILLAVSVLLAASSAAGCVGRENVLFATNSSIGLDLDTKPPAASLAFSRQEGSVAPVTEKGEVLPLMSSFAGGTGLFGTIFGSNVSQSFAVGNAAWVMSRYVSDLETNAAEDVAPESDLFTSAASSAVKGSLEDSKSYFFATDTTLGLKVGFSPAGASAWPDSLAFGWKRKELAFAPVREIGTDGNEEIVVAPLIATTDASAGSEQGGDTSIEVTQLYATGHAATLLAADPHVRYGLAEHILGDRLLHLIGLDDLSNLALLAHVVAELGRMAASGTDPEATRHEREVQALVAGTTFDSFVPYRGFTAAAGATPANLDVDTAPLPTVTDVRTAIQYLAFLRTSIDALEAAGNAIQAGLDVTNYPGKAASVVADATFAKQILREHEQQVELKKELDEVLGKDRRLVEAYRYVVLGRGR